MRVSLGSTQFVPPRSGVDPAVAQHACGIAKGTWDPTNVGCNLDIGPSLPSWCSVPFASSLFSDCALPTAAELTQYGAYTAYETAQLDTAAFTTPAGGPTGTTGSGADVATQMMQQNLDQSTALYNAQDCSYKAAANYPALSQIVGPSFACALTDPFNSYGWLVYLVLGIGAYMLLKGRS